MRLLVVLPIAAAAWAVPSIAAACSPLPEPSFAIRHDPSDTTPPGPARYALSEIHRGAPSGDSALCSDLGVFWIDVTPPEGERSEDIGYRVELASGQLPDGFTLFPPVRERWDGRLPFTWADGICLEQEPLDFVLRITPVDRAGNEGPGELMHVSDPGRAPSEGCPELPDEYEESAPPGDSGSDDAPEPIGKPAEGGGCSASGAGIAPLGLALAALLIGRHKFS